MGVDHVDLSENVSPAFIAGLEGPGIVEPLSSAEVQSGHDDLVKIIKAGSGDYASRHYRDDGTDKLAQIALAPQYLDKDGRVQPARAGAAQISRMEIGFVREDPEDMILVSEHLTGTNPWGDIINGAGITIRSETVKDVLFTEPDQVEGEDATFTVSVAETRTVKPAVKHPVEPAAFRDLMKRIRSGEVVAKDKPNKPVAELLSQTPAAAPETSAPVVAPATTPTA